jgi:hypothetical protein
MNRFPARVHAHLSRLTIKDLFTATAALVVVAAAARRRQLRWGASAAEVERFLVGDELLPEPNLTATRAITIRADVLPGVDVHDLLTLRRLGVSVPDPPRPAGPMTLPVRRLPRAR